MRLLPDYFAHIPAPAGGRARAALTGSLSFRHAKPGLIRGLMEERADPVLFHLSRDYVGDLSETVALMWPAAPAGATHVPSLAEVVEGLHGTSKVDLPSV